MNRGARRTPAAGLLCAALLLAGCAGCDSGGSGHRNAKAPGDTTCDGRIDGTSQITLWYHEAPASKGAIGKRDVLSRQVKAFNAAHEDVKARLVTLPPGDYNDQVRTAAADGELPDLLDFDAPNLFSYAWAGKIRPIDSCVPEDVRSDLLPSILEQGSYAGTLWGVGTFDSGLGMYVQPSVLEKAGIRIPHGPEDAWTADELTGILAKLRKQGYERPLDLQMRYADSEWGTYGFAPAVWSAGGDLIDRTTYRTADGVLNGPGAVKALTTLQRWAKAGYVDPDRGEDAFARGRSPLAWTGHWLYSDYSEAFPGDLRIVPLPDFGQGVATGMGSWQWGVPAGADDGDAVWHFFGTNTAWTSC